MDSPRHTSRELLDAQAKGARILHNDSTVEHRPRGPHDRKSWVVVGGGRVAAAQCQVYWPDGVPGA